MKNLNRRKFVGNISISALMAIFASLVPFKILGDNRKKIKFTLKNNPNSVKRTK